MINLESNNELHASEFSATDEKDFRVQFPDGADKTLFGSADSAKMGKNSRDTPPDFPTDFGYTLPDVVWDIPEKSRAEAARFTPDLCEYAGRFFIRGVLGMPLLEAQRSFTWGVWAEVDVSVFERYLDLYDADGSNEPQHPGILAHELPAYPASRGLQLTIQFQNQTCRPTLMLMLGRRLITP